MRTNIENAQAVIEANATPEVDVIVPQAGTCALTFQGAGEHAAVTGDLDDSPAIGAGDPVGCRDFGGSTCAADQRGEPRPTSAVQVASKPSARSQRAGSRGVALRPLVAVIRRRWLDRASRVAASTVLAVCIALSPGAALGAERIELPAIAGAIRQYGLDLLPLSFLAVKYSPLSSEDRTLLEFDLQGIPSSAVIWSAELGLPLRNIDPGGAIGFLDVYIYAGDGAITPLDFSAGNLFFSLPANVSGTYLVPVTQVVEDALDFGQPFAGARLSTATDDRYDLGELAGLPDPFLRIDGVGLPEPEGALLGLAALASLASLERRRAAHRSKASRSRRLKWSSVRMTT